MEHGKISEEQGLLARIRSSSQSDEEDDDIELDALEDLYGKCPSNTVKPRWWPSRFRRRRRQKSIIVKALLLHQFTRTRRNRSLFVRWLHLLTFVPHVVVTFILIYGVFLPSYSNPPQRYTDLRTRVQSSNVTGSANVNNEKVFIAASLYDRQGQLVSGDWGKSVRRLIDILGHENVFLSLYENDPDDQSKQALAAFHESLACRSSVVHERLDMEELPHISTPDGVQQVKRIAFLAEVRNRALRPLDDVRTEAYQVRWDKLLYLNDVAFDPVDAANLLFNTNQDETTGLTDYRAACAVDFINPFKFYDTYATRDLEGFDMGVPFYPWFTSAGNGTSRQDVLDQTDAVRVKSCWGGMIAFEAKWFQPHLYKLVGGDLVVPIESSSSVDPMAGEEDMLNHPISHNYYSLDTSSDVHVLQVEPRTNGSIVTAHDAPPLPPLRFRSETDTYWDASECCLIHADLAELLSSSVVGQAVGDSNIETGIYMNPYVRVAYSRSVLAWLPFTKRFERLYPFVHDIVNVIGRRPSYNPRRLEKPGDDVVNRVWRWDKDSSGAVRNGTHGQPLGERTGSYQEVKRRATPGQFCGSRRLSILLRKERDGAALWGSAKVPVINH